MRVLRPAYELIVIDAPPLLPFSDASAVAHEVDSVVLVIGRAPADDRQLGQAVRTLHAVGARRVGIVVNRWREGARPEPAARS